jgi:hypothetical protein
MYPALPPCLTAPAAAGHNSPQLINCLLAQELDPKAQAGLHQPPALFVHVALSRLPHHLLD